MVDNNPETAEAYGEDYRYVGITSETQMWWLIVSVGVFALIYFLFASFLKNHEALYHGSKFVPWILLLQVYVFFAVSSTGVGFIASFGAVFGNEKYKSISRLATFLSIVLLLAAFAAIGMEQERTFRTFVWIALSPNLSSPLVGMSLFYIMKLVWEIADFIFATLHRHSIARVAATLGLLSGIAAVSNLGSVFGLVGTRTLWHGAFMPLNFILSAIVSGAAIIIFVVIGTYYAWKREIPPHLKETLDGLGKILAFSLAVLLFFNIWNMRTGLWAQPEKYAEMMLLLSGGLAINFWGFELILGILIPLFILIRQRTRTLDGLFFSSFLVMVGMFAARYNHMIGGQLIPVIGGGFQAIYNPSLLEWAAALGVFGLVAYFYTLGTILFGFRELESVPVVEGG
ncbi:MAG: NrfD/PsrC family molybdoenzyme membrane anchor subunit [Candidatus Hydrothermarchaeales archaeon]